MIVNGNKIIAYINGSKKFLKILEIKIIYHLYRRKFSDIEGKDFSSLNSTTGALAGATIKESALNNIYW